jgi:hypothetical protein
MMKAISNYSSALVHETGEDWNHFWFAPYRGPVLDRLRLATGCVALLWWLSFLPDLNLWWGEDGLLPLTTLRTLVGAGSQSVYRFSWFYAGESLVIIGSLWCLGLIAIVLHTVGLFGRISTLLAWSFVISTVHRMPMIAGLMEPVLTMALAYLAIGLSNRQGILTGRLFPKLTLKPSSPLGDSLSRVSLRLLQLHTLFFYLVMATTQLRHDTWWEGEALWTMLAASETRPFDLSWLGTAPLALNLMTQAILVFEIAFPVLIWKVSLRPLLLGLSGIFWLVLALSSGLLLYCLLMFLMGLAFWPEPSNTQTTEIESEAGRNGN